MTHETHDHGSVQDLTYMLAQGRIADLRSSAAATVGTAGADAAGRGHSPEALNSRSVVARARDAVGRRLIVLGGSVVADEGLRRRALHL